MYYSTKLFDGFSACFRQWRAANSHCRYLHGYAISFKITFACHSLDDKNWCWDFGAFKRMDSKIGGVKISDWFSYWFDHTTIIATDDPKKHIFFTVSKEGACDIRIMPNVGCEKFAEFVYWNLRDVIHKESKGRVWIKSVECIENYKNSAIYEPSENNSNKEHERSAGV